MKDPAFLFYPADASEDTQFMNRLERGAYFDLVKSQRLFHGYTTVQLRKVLGKDYDEVWPALELILKQDENGYFIQWVRDSLTARSEFNKKQKERIEKRWNNHGNTTVLPKIENENGIVNENIIIEKGVQGEKIKYADYVTMTGKEHTKLIEGLGDEMTAMCIEKLNAYKGSKGKKYKSDYLAIRNWVANQVIIDKNNRNGITRKSGKQPATSAADIDFITAAMYRDQPVQ